MRRGYLWVAVGCLVVALALLAVGAARAQPEQCVVLVDLATAERAAHELVGYASVLQSGEPGDASMGHVMGLVDLANELLDAPRLGCDAHTAVDVRPAVAQPDRRRCGDKGSYRVA